MANPSPTANQLSHVSASVNDGKISMTQVLVISIALILNMLDGFDVTAMAFTVHSIGEDLHITPDHLGLVFSVALAGMMLGAMFIAPVSDMIGRRKMILCCVIAIGTSMYLTGYANQLWQLIILRMITGLGVGGMLASLAAMTAEYTPEKYRSLAVMCVTAGYPLGATLGGFIAAPLMQGYGWQSVFFCGGAATLVMVIAIYFMMPETIQFLITKRPENALQRINEILTRLNRETLTKLPTIDHETPIDKANVLSLLTESRRAKTITLWSTFFFCFICLYFMMSWIPKLVINSGLSESEGVYAAAAFNGGAVLGILSLGWLSARFALSRLIGTFLTSAGAGMILFAIASGTENLLTYLTAIGFLMQGGFVGLYALAAKIYPTEIRTTGVGWAIGLGRFGAVVGPYLGGVLIASGVAMEMNFIIFSLPLLTAGFLAYWLAVR